MKTVWSALLLGCGLTLNAQVSSDAPGAKQLADMAKHAREAGDFPKEGEDFCHAAAVDPKKYSKDCDRAKQHLAQVQAQFDSLFESARSEIKQKNFADAARDLSKIQFGPRKEIAQALLVQVQVVGHLVPPDVASRLSFQLASAAYMRGNLDEAEVWLKYGPVSLPRSPQAQLLTNIRIYRDTMQQGNELAANHDLAGAAQKYQFAARIVPNGPGNPTELLRRIQAAQSVTDQATQQLQTTQVAANSQNVGQTQQAKIASEAKRKLTSRNNVGSRQRDEGKQEQEQNLDATARDQLLDEGVRQFYASQFDQASKSLAMYLEKGGTTHTGAAEFYLGASFAALQLLSDPKDTERGAALQQQAQAHFAIARQSNFVPVKNAVSPRMMDVWMLSSKVR